LETEIVALMPHGSILVTLPAQLYDGFSSDLACVPRVNSRFSGAVDRQLPD